MAQIEFYDTRTRERRVFEPLNRKVGIYTCGPTVYAEQHVAISVTASRTAEALPPVRGLDVTHVINMDVGHLVSDADEGEDKMEAAAKKAGQTAEEIAAHYRSSGVGRAAVNCSRRSTIRRRRSTSPSRSSSVSASRKAAISTGSRWVTRYERFDRYAELPASTSKGSRRARGSV